MPITVLCPKCGRKIKAPNLPGKLVSCAGCGASVRIPAPEPDDDVDQPEEAGQADRRLPLVPIAAGLLGIVLFGSGLALGIAIERNRDKGQASAPAAAPAGAPAAAPAAEKAPPGQAMAPVATFAAPGLFEEYEKNALAADAKYKDRPVEVAGIVGKVEADAQRRYFVGFVIIEYPGVSQARYNRMTPQEKKWYNEGYPPNVIGYISPQVQADFAQLKKGDSVRIVGRCKGRQHVGPSVWKDFVVILDDCVLAKE